MDRNEIIERLERIAKHAVHTVGEPPFIMSLDDGVAIYEAIEALKSEPNCGARMNGVAEKEKSNAEECYNPCLTCSQIGNTFCDCSKR